MVATGQFGLGEVLVEAAAQLLQPGRLAARRRPLAQLGERSTAPQPTRRGERPDRSDVVVPRGASVAFGEEALEPGDVDGIRSGTQDVADRLRLDRAWSEYLAQPQNGVLDGLRR